MAVSFIFTTENDCQYFSVFFILFLKMTEKYCILSVPFFSVLFDSVLFNRFQCSLLNFSATINFSVVICPLVSIIISWPITIASMLHRRAEKSKTNQILCNSVALSWQTECAVVGVAPDIYQTNMICTLYSMGAEISAGSIFSIWENFLLPSHITCNENNETVENW